MEKKCHVCHTSENSKFKPKRFDICIECYRVLHPKSYLCKNCLSDDPKNFYKDRFSSCKKCRNIKSSDSHQKKYEQNSKDSLESKVKEIAPIPAEFQNYFEKMFYSLMKKECVSFEGKSPKSLIFSLNERINSLVDENKHLKIEIIQNNLKISSLKNEFYKTLHFLNTDSENKICNEIIKSANLFSNFENEGLKSSKVLI